MKTLLLSLLLGWTTSASAAGNDGNRFACELYKALAENPGNLFISPYSLSSALTMASAGARGDTLKELQNTLHLGEDPHGAEKKLRNSLTAGAGAGQPELRVANRLWGRTGRTYDPAFLALTRDDYAAGLTPLDFAGDPAGARRTINDWAESETHHRIHELVPEGAINQNTDLILTNAVYFKGNWADSFDPKNTHPETFHGVGGADRKRPFLHRTFRVPYWENTHFQAVRLAYEGNALSMTIILPKPGTSTARLAAELSPELLAQIRHQTNVREVKLSLPKFKLEYSADLKNSLQKLGVKLAFSTRADFSAIRPPAPGEPFYVSRVLQKAFVEVDEKGTEAAAATAGMMEMGAAIVKKADPVAFTADRPFLFVIEHGPSDTVLFLGRLSSI